MGQIEHNPIYLLWIDLGKKRKKEKEVFAAWNLPSSEKNESFTTAFLLFSNFRKDANLNFSFSLQSKEFGFQVQVRGTYKPEVTSLFVRCKSQKWNISLSKTQHCSTWSARRVSLPWESPALHPQLQKWCGCSDWQEHLGKCLSDLQGLHWYSH